MRSAPPGPYNSSMPHKTFFRSRKGYTIMEIVVVVTILGILTATTYVYSVGLVNASRDKDAIARAQSINAAEQAYSMRVSTASSNWSSAANDAARFALIEQYIPFTNGISLAGYMPNGYTLTLGSTLNVKVAITGPSGAVTY